MLAQGLSKASDFLMCAQGKAYSLGHAGRPTNDRRYPPRRFACHLTILPCFSPAAPDALMVFPPYASDGGALPPPLIGRAESLESAG
jgi:hypothetical protein